MSSFPQHKENIMALKGMGFDVEECLEDGEVTIESWGYDDLTYLISDIICHLQSDKYRVGCTVDSELIDADD